MSMQLKLDEMLDAMKWMDHPQFADFEARAVQLANEIAKALADELPVEAGEASFQGMDFAGLCVPFRPLWKGQPIPEPLIGYEPPRVYRRVKHSKDEPYDKETIHPRLSG